MQVNRPNIIARKTIIPVFSWGRIFMFLIFTALAVVLAIMGKDIVASVPSISFIEPYVPILVFVFAALDLIPIVGVIIDIIWIRSYRVEFYDTYIIIKKGVFNKEELKFMFPKILSCEVKRRFWGRIFNYGNIKVDAIGKWDLKDDELNDISRPLFVRKYLENHFISAKEIRAMRQTVITP